MKATEELQVTVITNDIDQISTSAIIFALFGMSVEELAKEIRDSENNQYDGVITNKEIAV